MCDCSSGIPNRSFVLAPVTGSSLFGTLKTSNHGLLLDYTWHWVFGQMVVLFELHNYFPQSAGFVERQPQGFYRIICYFYCCGTRRFIWKALISESICDFGFLEFRGKQIPVTINIHHNDSKSLQLQVYNLVCLQPCRTSCCWTAVAYLKAFPGATKPQCLVSNPTPVQDEEKKSIVWQTTELDGHDGGDLAKLHPAEASRSTRKT